MGEGVSPEIRRLLDERRIIRSRMSRETIMKELQGAKYDLEKARGSLKTEDFKWATIQAYYAMFHSARALLYGRGFREKSHRALLVAIEELFVRTGKLDRSSFDLFRNAIDLREEADYGMAFSKSSAERVVENAKNFVERIQMILGA